MVQHPPVGSRPAVGEGCGDIVVSVSPSEWRRWLSQGDLAGSPPTGREHVLTTTAGFPDIGLGDRVYVAAFGRLRGYAPLVRLAGNGNRVALVRQGGGVAVTIDEPIADFAGWRYRWWPRDTERLFADWLEDGIPPQDRLDHEWAPTAGTVARVQRLLAAGRIDELTELLRHVDLTNPDENPFARQILAEVGEQARERIAV